MSIERIANSVLVVKLLNTLNPAVNAIVSQQTAPVPTNSFTSVHLMTVVSTGKENISYADDPGPAETVTETIEDFKELHFSLNFFKDSAQAKANFIRAALVSSQAKEFMYINGFGLGRRGHIRNITSKRTESYEERAQFDVVFHITDSYTFTLNTIAEIDIAGEVKASQEIDININVK